MDVPRNDQQSHCVDHDNVKARSDRSMKWFTAMLLTVMLTPLARAAQHDEWALVAHGGSKKSAYLVLRMITQEIELIPVESLNQCENIGRRVMNGGKLSKFLKGYKCISDFHYAKQLERTYLLPQSGALEPSKSSKGNA